MSIGVIMFTLVTKIEAIQQKYPGGLDSYLKSPYVWHDEHIVGSSFMGLRDVISTIGMQYYCFNCMKTCPVGV